MARPFTRAQALQNAAFLRALRKTGNAREAARMIDSHRSTFTKRRARDVAFAAQWDAALALAHARLQAAPESSGDAPRDDREPVVTRTRSGRLQLRRPRSGGLTRDHEQAFLAALSATANVRLSAAAAGFSHSAFYWRARHSPAFAREMRLALEMGYDRVELALLAGFDPASHADDAWRSNDPPPIPSMSPAQAIQLLHLHHKTARLWAERPDKARRRSETGDARADRVGEQYVARLARDAEDRVLEQVLRNRAWEGGQRSPHAPAAPTLPALDQVTGWSEADAGKSPHHGDVAMFGGWRLDDWDGGRHAAKGGGAAPERSRLAGERATRDKRPG